MRTLFTLLILIISHENPTDANAFTDFPNPIFQIEKTEDKTFVVEQLFPYTAYHYKQPLKLKNINESDSNYDTPENALITILSALKNLNVNWVLNSWDETSRKALQAKLNKKMMKKALKSWKRTYSESDFFLLKRVDRQFKDFVILEYKIKHPTQGESRHTYNFRKEHAKWKSTNIFSDDLLSIYLTSDKDRIKVPGD